MLTVSIMHQSINLSDGAIAQVILLRVHNSGTNLFTPGLVARIAVRGSPWAHASQNKTHMMSVGSPGASLPC
jgi:hypothetical protein